MLKRVQSRLQILAASFAQSKRLQLAAGVLALAGLSGILLHSSLRKGGLWDSARFNDFRAYHNACRLVLRRELCKAYEHADRPYQYPPTLAAVLAPLGLLPEKAALAVWAAGCLGLLLWCFRCIDGVLGPPVLGIDKLAGFLLVFRLVESDFANSNANVIILALVVGGFLLERRGRSGMAGQVLALSACIKVYPILILPWILYRKRWRMAGGYLAGLVLWGALVPGTILGPEDFLSSWKAWHGQMLAPLIPAAEDPGAGAGEPEYVPGQSIRSLLHHLLRRTDATAHDEASVPVHWVDLPEPAVEAIYWACALAILGAALWTFYERGACNRWSGLELAAAALLTVLLSPLARKAHFVLLFPAAVLGFAAARSGMQEKQRRRLPAVLWAAALGLILFSSNILGDRLSALVMAYCPLTWAAAALLAALVLERRRVGRN